MVLQGFCTVSLQGYRITEFWILIDTPLYFGKQTVIKE